MSKEESGKWQALFWKLVGLACEPFTAAGAVLRNDPDKQASSVRLFKGIRGSCFMDLGIGVIMCFLLGLTGMGQYECIEHMHRRHHAIDKGEWVRYIAYLVYFLLGMTAMYLYRAKKTQACAGRIWLFMAFLCFYIMFWSMVVIVIGFDSIATLEACNKQTSLIFASSFSLFTFALGLLHFIMCAGLGYYVVFLGVRPPAAPQGTTAHKADINVTDFSSPGYEEMASMSASPKTSVSLDPL